MARGVHGRIDLTKPSGGSSATAGGAAGCEGITESNDFGSMNRMLVESSTSLFQRYKNINSLVVKIVMKLDVQAFYIFQRRNNLDIL